MINQLSPASSIWTGRISNSWELREAQSASAVRFHVPPRDGRGFLVATLERGLASDWLQRLVNELREVGPLGRAASDVSDGRWPPAMASKLRAMTEERWPPPSGGLQLRRVEVQHQASKYTAAFLADVANPEITWMYPLTDNMEVENGLCRGEWSLSSGYFALPC